MTERDVFLGFKFLSTFTIERRVMSVVPTTYTE
jgi:hypothetical protein